MPFRLGVSRSKASRPGRAQPVAVDRRRRQPIRYYKYPIDEIKHYFGLLLLACRVLLVPMRWRTRGETPALETPGRAAQTARGRSGTGGLARRNRRTPCGWIRRGDDGPGRRARGHKQERDLPPLAQPRRVVGGRVQADGGRGSATSRYRRAPRRRPGAAPARESHLLVASRNRAAQSARRRGRRSTAPGADPGAGE